MIVPSLERDFVGYGANPPDPRWPGGARLAVNFVLNYEEGSEPTIADQDGFSEAGLTEVPGSPVPHGERDLAAESMFEYGSRVGFWRLQRLFSERRLRCRRGCGGSRTTACNRSGPTCVPTFSVTTFGTATTSSWTPAAMLGTS